MGVKVAKFGGSSLADAGQVRKVVDIVNADPDRRYVVVSAPGKRHGNDQKITDLLYLCHDQARLDQPFDQVIERIERRYHEIAADLGLKLDLHAILAEARAGIAASAGDGPDFAASRGEYVNAQLVAEALGWAFVDAAELIVFDARGRFDPVQTYPKVEARLAGVERAVIPGFYGADAAGKVRTFSRGGSDVTGAIVARGAKAAVYENWTDVSGLCMADPRLVTNPRTIDVVTYQELRELAYSGATVLHDEAVFPVRQAGIPVHIRNTNAPQDPGTRIIRDDLLPDDAEEPTRRGTITGIAGRKDFTVITVEKALMNAALGFGRRVLDVIEAQGISFEHMPSSIDTLSLVIADAQLEGKLRDVIEQIDAAVDPDRIDVDSELALIATVGRGMAQTPGMAAKVFGALAAAEVNIRMIDQGSSELNIIVGVNSADFDRAVRAIYAAFVGGDVAGAEG